MIPVKKKFVTIYIYIKNDGPVKVVLHIGTNNKLEWLH